MALRRPAREEPGQGRLEAETHAKPRQSVQAGQRPGVGSRPQWQHRCAPPPAKARAIGAGLAHHARKPSQGNALGTAARKGILVSASGVPETGALAWPIFDPQAGREHAGRRPALVLSPRVYNAKSGLALVSPVTNRVKGYPFEVPVPAARGITGVVLADHVKSVDWKACRAERAGRCPTEALEEVRSRLAPLLGF